MSTLPYSLNQLFNITKIDVVQSLDTHALRATLEWIIQSLQNQTSNDDLLQKVDEASKDRSSMSSTIEDLVHKQVCFLTALFKSRFPNQEQDLISKQSCLSKLFCFVNSQTVFPSPP